MAETDAGSSPNARFLADTAPGGRRGRSRYGGALSVSMASHVVGLLLVLGVMSRLPADTATPRQPAEVPGIVWLVSHGGNPGGGGGNESPKPPRTMEAPGRDRVTVPVKPSFSTDPDPRDVPPPQPAALAIPALPTVSGLDQAIGVVSELPSLPSNSQGPGKNGNGGPGKGGNGPGPGSGVGPPSDGCCDGVFTTGIDIVGPQLIREIKPGYTSEAMRAKVQGMVVLEAVVLPDGSVGTVHILKSLDPIFGLDKEAVKTVKLWRFKPGTKSGKPVPILVQIDLAFTLR